MDFHVLVLRIDDIVIFQRYVVNVGPGVACACIAECSRARLTPTVQKIQRGD